MTDRDFRPFITVTNEVFRHPKFRSMTRSARLRVLELWAHCNEFRTDGRIDDGIWLEIPAKERKELEAYGWVEYKPDRVCHDYLKHQKSKAELEVLQSNRSTSGAWGAHIRHHEKKHVISPDCEFCQLAKS
jgi:hypothetical protein